MKMPPPLPLTLSFANCNCSSAPDMVRYGGGGVPGGVTSPSFSTSSQEPDGVLLMRSENVIKKKRRDD